MERYREAALLELIAEAVREGQEQEQEQEQPKEQKAEAEAEAEEDQDIKNLGEQRRRFLLSPRMFQTTEGPRLRLGCWAASNGRWCA